MAIAQITSSEGGSTKTILMVLGVMKGPWLNSPATNKYERLGIVFHILTDKNEKINEGDKR